ncbi:MAG TPA: Stk1 family PASTA domain-containing Ser/Thr kinase [Clostridiales bacterium]|jgi:serine/threonine-protein kinase|nr:Stk1 family PASTA domain-containing Ser/Thr kinase [Clostridiales bacterium]
MSSRILAGRYELVEKIGDGGMAVVYKARCRLLNRHVAVKILKPEFTRDAKFIENFRKESQAAASLTHPNIVNVYDVGREGGINYIVMELIEGQPLSEIIRERAPLSVDETVTITKQIASALSFAHKNHIIHRDVKPHNIMITEDGIAKITDFGIAKAMNAETIDDQTGSIMGSVHYFSPEQARGGYVDEKSDLYSLGIVMYEMMTGEVPFDGENPVAVAMKHINEPIEPPSKLVPGIPPDVEAIVMKATDKYQVNRYKSADEMLDALNFASLSPIGVYADYQKSTGAKNLDATQMINMVNQSSPNTTAGRGGAMPPTVPPGRYNSNGKKPKPKSQYRGLKIIAIILALLVTIPASYYIYNIIKGGDQAGSVTVPELKGKTIAEAKEELEAVDLKLVIGDTVEDSEYPAGQIVSQDPEAGNKVRPGGSVTANISGGQPKGTVPNVVTLTLEAAKLNLETQNYTNIKVVEEFSDEEKGIVIKQNPEGGTQAEVDTEIKLTVSKGAEIVSTIVPRLTGHTVAKAEKELEKQKLLLNKKYKYKPSNEVQADRIMDQSIPPGTSVDSGTEVTITISTGPADSGANPDVAIRIDYSPAKNEVFYLTVTVSDESGLTMPINNAQRLKSAGSENFVVTGSGPGVVQIFFDNILIREYKVNFNTGEVH